ncbi:hypothetical protein PpBr36_04657 [Pyricularia pennisetigena]|uniref:hypothetical protein n=1 Tax=Pyricularia pennisetigena TaxID=1578925 RepID=UPI001151A3C6|nr:hypothetical protein PpBr36_04657 [Pyricularia pennisetigena]TLS26906.1 hypothetical protein PpBr36_04657 [Pyricularia pennisetigena]
MRSLAALVLLPLLAEAAGSQNVKRQQQCRNDSCFRAVAPENRRQDCQNFIGTTTVTGDLTLETAFVTVGVTGFVDVDAIGTVAIPVTAQVTHEVTNTLTSYVATVTSTVVQAAPTDASPNLAKRRWGKRQWDWNWWMNNAKMPGGYPMYAATCWDTSRYISACNCAGVNTMTMTLPGPVSTTTFTVYSTDSFQTNINTVGQNTVTNVVATNIATQTVSTVVQATQTVVVTAPEGGNPSTTGSPGSLTTADTSSVSEAASSTWSSSSEFTSSTMFSSDGPIPTTAPFSNSTQPPISQHTETVVATVTASGSMSDLTRATQSLSSAIASDFPTSILTANTTFATATKSTSATPTPTGVAKSFRLKVQSGPLADSYLVLQAWKDLGAANGGEAYLITFAGGNNGSTAAPSLWAMGGGLDMPDTSSLSIYAIDAPARGKVIVSTVGMNSRLAVAAPGAGAAYLASDLLQCAIDATNTVTCQEAGPDGAPYNQLGNCGEDMGIFKGSNTCGGGTLFALTAEYV